MDDGRGSASPGSGGDGIGNLDGAREAKVDFATDGQCWTGLPMVKVRCTPLED